MSEEKTIWEADENQEMRAAALQARRTFKYFWRELSWENRRIIPGLSLSAVKMAFATDDRSPGVPTMEHMWVGEIAFDGDIVSGVLLNAPRWTSTIEQGATVKMPLAQIDDWMYALMGDVYGGFSVDVMRRGMAVRERDQHDKAWGLNFPAPGAVRVVPPLKGEKQGFMAKLFSKKVDAVGDENAEHPMSGNMVEKFADALKTRPEVVNRVDEEGWTLLQREALAGNHAQVVILLEHGADAGVRNTQGMSALDLARKMGWLRIVGVLEEK